MKIFISLITIKVISVNIKVEIIGDGFLPQRTLYTISQRKSKVYNVSRDIQKIQYYLTLLMLGHPYTSLQSLYCIYIYI